MKIYLASAWGRREEMQAIAQNLQLMGHEITSRWLTDKTDSWPKDKKASDIEIAELEKEHVVHALHDVEDVLSADAIVRFSDAPEMVWPLVPARLLSGARNFEFGLMYGARIFGDKERLFFVVDGKQNIFDRLPAVMVIRDTNQLYEVMSRAAELEGIK